MRIFNRSTLTRFGKRHADADAPLRAWYHEVSKSLWSSPNEIKSQYVHASILGNRRVVFNIGGNKYRLVAEINYDYHIVFIRFIGTHRKYDSIDAETI